MSGAGEGPEEGRDWQRLDAWLWCARVAKTRAACSRLVEAGAVRGGALGKVLGDGDINVALNVTADAFSNSAKEKLAAAGGSAVEA